MFNNALANRKAAFYLLLLEVKVEGYTDLYHSTLVMLSYTLINGLIIKPYGHLYM